MEAAAALVSTTLGLNVMPRIVGGRVSPTPICWKVMGPAMRNRAVIWAALRVVHLPLLSQQLMLVIE
jgi:hypothetical protein